MNKKTVIFVGVAAAVVAAVAFFVFVKPKTPSNDDVLHVTASASFWGDIAKQIGGGNVTVTSILDDPEADPHLYESGARDASNITKADLVIANGLGYDDFIDKVLSTAPNTGRSYLKVSDLLKSKSDANPHLWYDLSGALIVAGDIEARLSQLDPTHSASYKANLATFTEALQPLFDRIGTIKALHSNAAVAYTERVPEYMLVAAGLRIVSPTGFAAAIEEGNEPGPADQAAMRDLITQKQISAFLYNSQAESPVTQSMRELAQQNNIPVVAVSETAPDGKNYQDWQLAQLDALLAALNNKQ